ncbi:MBL fold metallo-hydrolase [Methanocella conradii]|uniref:MBL fold metallo-hydrolase n=1 Tax=Methanocella conradii TaxID=1175444 RepID=UPI00157CD5A5|nr:MBL fold metallo-hydrolase [Methanocella conradii]
MEVKGIQIKFLGAAREVGRSAFLLNDKVLLDYGIKPSDPPEYPVGSPRPETVVISHGHLDHCGVVPNLMDLEPVVLATPPTKHLTRLLAEDTLEIAERCCVPPFDPFDMQVLSRRTRVLDYLEDYSTEDYTITFLDAGHIPGSALTYVEFGDDTLLYTGDIKNSDTRLLNGSKIHYPEARALLVESTYFGKEHQDRKALEERFIESIRYTLDTGGNVVIPCFAIGRTQEILMILKEHGIGCFVDGMGVDVTDMLLKQPEYLKDSGRLKTAYGHATTVKGRMRRAVLDEPSVVVTTAGMLNGGPVLYYLKQIYDDPHDKLILTGFQVEGTNGRMALDTNTVEVDGEVLPLRCKLEQYSFSAHSGDSELKAIVKHMCDKGTEKVFCVHGDNTEAFAEWVRSEIGVDAYAPRLGEEYTV